MSRTKLGIKVTIVAIISAVIMGIISLVRVKIILQNYGGELNGIVQVAIQMSTYLILIESGMTAAYQYNMYSKILNNDIYELSRLYNGLVINMQKIAKKMFFICMIVPFIYAFLINRTNVTYWYAVLILIVMGIRFVIPYIFVVPQMGILAAAEKQYIVDIVQLFMNILAIIAEIIGIYVFQLPLYIVLSFYIFCILLTMPIYNYLIKKYISLNIDNKINPDMSPIKMTNDIIVHQVSSLIFLNTDNIILSIFKSLDSVTVYSAFNTLISYPVQLINKIISGLRASVAIKIQQKDKRSFTIYNEIFSVESFCSSIVIPIFIIMSNKFIIIWIGSEYTLKLSSITLFALIILNRMITPVILAVRDAAGLYKESKKYTIIQALTNVILSLLFVKKMGIFGILFGTVISSYIIATPMNFYLIYSNIFNKKIYCMIKNISYRYVQIFFITILIIFIDRMLTINLRLTYINTINCFVVKSMYLFFITFILSFVIHFISDKYFRIFIKRLSNNLKK